MQPHLTLHGPELIGFGGVIGKLPKPIGMSMK